MRSVQRYGWAPDLPDHRDHQYSLRTDPLPSSYDQRPNWPAVYDQGQLGSCTGNGVGGVCHYRQVREQKDAGRDVNSPACVPSRLFIYFRERVLEGTVATDAGAQIRDGIKAVVRFGFPGEDLWPYVVTRFAVPPSHAAYAAAAGHKVSGYARVDNTILSALKSAAAADDPVVFGCTVYDSFESEAVARTGVVPLPAKGESVAGGHCMVIVGYDDGRQAFLVRNSWGAAWGLAGHCWMPYAYLTNSDLASDFWVVTATP